MLPPSAANDKGYEGLFDLSVDPNEHNNLKIVMKPRFDQMKASLAGYLATLPRPDRSKTIPTVVDEETVRALEGLGYIGTSDDE